MVINPGQILSDLGSAVNNFISIRPAVILKSGIKITDGIGTQDSPYVVE